MSIFHTILTHSMVQSPSWEANWFEASQEFPRISRNPKVHYRTHKRPPPVSILVKPNPVHIPTSHLLEIHPNIIHPSTPRSPSGLFPSGFSTKTLYTPLYSPTRATCPTHNLSYCRYLNLAFYFVANVSGIHHVFSLSMKTTVFWDVTPCNLVEMYRRFVFVEGLMNDAVRRSYCMGSNDDIMCVNNELIMLWKELVVA